MSDTLEDFLGRYVRNKKLANSAESYEKWLSAYGTDADAALGERLSDIEKSYESAKSTYGKNAERLAALGLSSSGYSDYLNGAAYAEKERAKSAAYRTAAETEAKNRRGYERYLASYRDGQDTLLKEAYKTIAASGTFDEDGAYRRALSMGLDGAAAKEAAAGGVALAKEKARRALFKTILSEGLGREGAVAYAKNYGFSATEADAFGDYADKVNGSESVKAGPKPEEKTYDGSFTDYLRRRLKSQIEKY